MPTYDDAVPVVGTVIVTLANARLYNPSLVNIADANAQLAIDAATCYLLGHPGLTISDLTGPYPTCVQQVTSMLAGFIWTTTGLNGSMLSESLGDYSYTSGLGIMLNANPVVQLMLAMLSKYIRRSAPVSVRRDDE